MWFTLADLLVLTCFGLATDAMCKHTKIQPQNNWRDLTKDINIFAGTPLLMSSAISLGGGMTSTLWVAGTLPSSAGSMDMSTPQLVFAPSCREIASCSQYISLSMRVYLQPKQILPIWHQQRETNLLHTELHLQWATGWNFQGKCEAGLPLDKGSHFCDWQ